MSTALESVEGRNPVPRNRGRQWIALFSAGALALELPSFLMLVWHSYIDPVPGIIHFAPDFSIFWSAAVVALHHGAAAVSDPAAITATIKTVQPHWGGPWVYPPTFLLAVYPFGALPYAAAVGLFSAIGVLAYVSAIPLVARPIGWSAALPAIAFPGFFLALGFGQNSLITLGIAAAALSFLPSRPVLSGMFIALLCIKPQLGMLFPLVLICGRQWRALASATVFSIAFCAITSGIFGIDSFLAFMKTAAAFRQTFIDNDPKVWRAMPTIYGIARTIGLSAPAAYALQAMMATPALSAVSWLWSANGRYELKAAAFCTATLLVLPYMGHYDLAWLALPVGFLASDMAKHGVHRIEIAILTSAWLVPLQAIVGSMHGSIHWAPGVLLALLTITVWRHLKSRQATGTGTSSRHVTRNSLEVAGDHCCDLRNQSV